MISRTLGDPNWVGGLIVRRFALVGRAVLSQGTCNVFPLPHPILAAPSVLVSIHKSCPSPLFHPFPSPSALPLRPGRRR